MSRVYYKQCIKLTSLKDLIFQSHMQKFLFQKKPVEIFTKSFYENILLVVDHTRYVTIFYNFCNRKQIPCILDLKLYSLTKVSFKTVFF